MCLITQLCPTLCNPTDCSLPGSSVHGDSPGKNTGMGCRTLIDFIRFFIYPSIDLHSFYNRSVLSSIYMQKFSWLQIIKTGVPVSLETLLNFLVIMRIFFSPPALLEHDLFQLHSCSFKRFLQGTSEITQICLMRQRTAGNLRKCPEQIKRPSLFSRELLLLWSEGEAMDDQEPGTSLPQCQCPPVGNRGD